MVTLWKALHTLSDRAVINFWQPLRRTPRGSRVLRSARREWAREGAQPRGLRAGPAAQPRTRRHAPPADRLPPPPRANGGAAPRGPSRRQPMARGPWERAGLGERPLGSSGPAPVGGVRRARPGPARQRRCGAGANGAAGSRSWAALEHPARPQVRAVAPRGSASWRGSRRGAPRRSWRAVRDSPREGSADERGDAAGAGLRSLCPGGAERRRFRDGRRRLPGEPSGSRSPARGAPRGGRLRAAAPGPPSPPRGQRRPCRSGRGSSRRI